MEDGLLTAEPSDAPGSSSSLMRSDCSVEGHILTVPGLDAGSLLASYTYGCSNVEEEPLNAVACMDLEVQIASNSLQQPVVPMPVAGVADESGEFVMLAGAYCPNPLDDAGLLSFGGSVCYCAQLLAGNQMLLQLSLLMQMCLPFVLHSDATLLPAVLRLQGTFCSWHLLGVGLFCGYYDEVVMFDAECGSGADNQDAGILISAGCEN
ncbi:hypothetical protein Nepgr_030050 [Nepenthes gracilis]|uniref:Uncharacterized protein n=1 Tax=Nepenthes gracilis TaxID=150966 RepID=A0AAD3TF27_NEPGR|nr:hypothetical protein Nepgr_030050 [Nepenthes gracilis]